MVRAMAKKKEQTEKSIQIVIFSNKWIVTILIIIVIIIGGLLRDRQNRLGYVYGRVKNGRSSRCLHSAD
jgi:hypothetical protein